MPGPLVHVGALITCPHQGAITVTPAGPKVFVSGQPVLTKTDIHKIVGCTFTVPGPKPQPCITVQLEPATRVFVNGKPAVIFTVKTLCVSAEQVPQGPPNASPIQKRVTAT